MKSTIVRRASENKTIQRGIAAYLIIKMIMGVVALIVAIFLISALFRGFNNLGGLSFLSQSPTETIMSKGDDLKDLASYMSELSDEIAAEKTAEVTAKFEAEKTQAQADFQQKLSASREQFDKNTQTSNNAFYEKAQSVQSALTSAKDDVQGIKTEVENARQSVLNSLGN